MRNSLPRPTGTLPISKGGFTDLFDHTQGKGGQHEEISVIAITSMSVRFLGGFKMILLGLSVLVLSVGLQVQPQTAPSPATSPVPVTAVMAMTSLKPGVAPSDAMKLVQEEVRVAVQLYLDGKIDQWYTRSDGKGAVLFVHCQTVDEAKAVLSGLP